jgi:hypothetical protein
MNPGVFQLQHLHLYAAGQPFCMGRLSLAPDEYAGVAAGFQMLPFNF